MVRTRNAESRKPYRWRAENPSLNRSGGVRIKLNRSGGVRIKLSHALDRTIRTLLRKFASSSTSDDVTSRKSPELRSTTSVPSWRVVVPPATSVCSEKCKSGWKDLFLTHNTNPDEWEYSLSIMNICIFSLLMKAVAKPPTFSHDSLCVLASPRAAHRIVNEDYMLNAPCTCYTWCPVRKL